uniref:C-type lectin domain-containing protein n=1 Tax=Chelydra serpentina TaxID=8475 RepID=A0A8C3T3G5_CHESE
GDSLSQPQAHRGCWLHTGSLSVWLHWTWEGASHPGRQSARTGMLKRAVWLLLWRYGWDSLPGPELGYSGFCFLDSVCGHCPWGWAWFQRTCYHFSDSMKTWNEAKQSCLDFGAHLVIINTKEEQAFLVKTRTKSRVYWLGLSDQKVERQWHWVDGSPLKLSFWSTGEPNDSSDEDCGTMALDGRWNDINCYMTDYWICEKPWLC